MYIGNEIKKYIRESWFKDHKATLTKHGDLEILEWKDPSTRIYAVRYVFDKNRMYITGDIGEALFNLTWDAKIDSFNDIDIYYLMEKMTAFSDNKYSFNRNLAKEELEEWRKEYLEANYDMEENELKDFNNKFNKLVNTIDECSNITHWIGIVNERYNNFIEEIDPDYWEWIYDIGKEVPIRVYGYVVGLQMASEQLRRAQYE